MLKALVVLLSRLRRAFRIVLQPLASVLRRLAGGGPAAFAPPVELVEEENQGTPVTKPSAGHEAHDQAVVLRKAAEARLQGVAPGPGAAELPDHLRRWLDGMDRASLATLAETPVLLLARHLKSRRRAPGLPVLPSDPSEVPDIAPSVPGQRPDTPVVGLRLGDLISDRQALQDRIGRKIAQGALK